MWILFRDIEEMSANIFLLTLSNFPVLPEYLAEHFSHDIASMFPFFLPFGSNIFKRTYSLGSTIAD
jgi:hypothetical protein